MRWTHSIVTPASIEVISLEEAKAELDVTFNDDDAMIMRQLAAAIQFVEGYTSSFLAPTVVDLFLEGLPSSNKPIHLPFGPLQSIASVQYSQGGVLTPFTAFEVIPGDLARLQPSTGYFWPYTGSAMGSGRVRAAVGYPDGQCPPALIQATMLALRAYYEAPDPSTLQGQLEAARAVAGPYKLGFM